MSATNDAETFLRDYAQDYRDLLKVVATACEQAQTKLGRDVVIDVYTRPDDPSAGGPFKAPHKIAAKIRQWNLPPTTASFLQINDVIGVTVVVGYPDQVNAVVDAVKKALARKAKWLNTLKHEAKNGYYATHLNYAYLHKAETLHFEVQIKTLLHNAWSKKMHDLTYKPVRAFDPRLSALMASVAATIESLEEQSTLIRDMIKANWNVEDEARREARQGVFDTMLEYAEADGLPPALKALSEKVSNAKGWIATEPADSKRLKDLTSEISKCCADPAQIRFGWILAGRLASLRSDQDLNRFFRKYANAWLDEARKLYKAKQIKSVEFRAVPMVLYVIGDLESAIDYSDLILKDANFAGMQEFRRTSVALNRIVFLIEREYHNPTSQEAQRAIIHNEIKAFLADPKLENHPDKDFRSVREDTEGMMIITFAKTAKETWEGIEKCIGAIKDVEQDVSIAEAYAALNVRLGWRRYFELEVQEQARPKPAHKGQRK